MKKLKTIKLIQKGNPLSNNEMEHIIGGYDVASNSNTGTGCSCDGSTDGHFWCNDNSNSASSCSCYGNDNNTNKTSGCTCGTPPNAPATCNMA